MNDQELIADLRRRLSEAEEVKQELQRGFVRQEARADQSEAREARLLEVLRFIADGEPDETDWRALVARDALAGKEEV